MRKILVADDDEAILSLMSILLEDLNATVLLAKNGEEAIQAIIAELPDLAILDIAMPIKSGLDVCRIIRHTPSVAHTPIIMLSAADQEQSKLIGFEEGADDYITKPFSGEELKARIKALLARAKPITISSTISEKTDTSDADRVPSGNAQLDALLMGGFPKGANILVIGKVGHGKSTFARNFISSGLIRGERCLVLTLDDPPAHIRRSLSLQLPKSISDYEKVNLMRLIDAYSTPVADTHERFSPGSSAQLHQLLESICDAGLEIGQSTHAKVGGRRIIDSITRLVTQSDLLKFHAFLTELTQTSAAFGGVTTLFLIESDAISTSQLNAINYLFDGVIEFTKTDSDYHVQVVSMKWSSYIT